MHSQVSASAAKRAAYQTDIAALTRYRASHKELSAGGQARLVKLRKALDDSDKPHKALMDKAKQAVKALGKSGATCAGVAEGIRGDLPTEDGKRRDEPDGRRAPRTANASLMRTS